LNTVAISFRMLRTPWSRVVLGPLATDVHVPGPQRGRDRAVCGLSPVLQTTLPAETHRCAPGQGRRTGQLFREPRDEADLRIEETSRHRRTDCPLREPQRRNRAGRSARSRGVFSVSAAQEFFEPRVPLVHDLVACLDGDVVVLQVGAQPAEKGEVVAEVLALSRDGIFHTFHDDGRCRKLAGAQFSSAEAKSGGACLVVNRFAVRTPSTRACPRVVGVPGGWAGETGHNWPALPSSRHPPRREKPCCSRASPKRAMGLEPTTLSLGSASRPGWTDGFHSTLQISYRSNPLKTAPAGQSLAHNWRAHWG
jgi:hypothetical protein